MSSLQAARVRHRTVGWYTPCRSRREVGAPAGNLASSGARRPRALHVNADVLPQLVGRAGATILRDRYRIGVWFWEPGLPREPPAAFAHVDEVWVASEFGRDFRIAAPVPSCMPLALGIARRSALSLRLGFGDEFVFLFLFDLPERHRRKNPFDLIDAYRVRSRPATAPAS